MEGIRGKKRAGDLVSYVHSMRKEFLIPIFIILIAFGLYYNKSIKEKVLSWFATDVVITVSEETMQKDDLIKVVYPKKDQIVTSPLQVTGEARGTWFFEASFPVRLLDANNNEIAVGIAQAQGEWMTQNYVPFKADIVFTSPTTDTGFLVLQKDNPSGLPEHDNELRFPIRFR